MTVKIVQYLGHAVTAPDGTKHPAWVVECANCKTRVMYAVQDWNGQPHSYTCSECGYEDTFTGAAHDTVN